MDQQFNRLRLRVATKLMLVFAALIIAYVVLSVLFSSDPESRVIPGKTVNIGQLQTGQTKIILWEGRPVLVYRRTDEQIRRLQDNDDRLADAQSRRSKQPAWATDSLRSRIPAVFVSIGVGTDFSCPIKLSEASVTPFKGQAWAGGFADECRGARYDFAGRVYSGQYADKNLIIPDYRIDGDVLILGG